FAISNRGKRNELSVRQTEFAAAGAPARGRHRVGRVHRDKFLARLAAFRRLEEIEKAGGRPRRQPRQVSSIIGSSAVAEKRAGETGNPGPDRCHGSPGPPASEQRPVPGGLEQGLL